MNRPRPPGGAGLRPTPRGLGATGALVALVAVGWGAGVGELAPLALVVLVPLVAAPCIAARRGRRARTGLAIHVQAAPALVPVGGRASFRYSLVDHAGPRGGTLSVERGRPGRRSPRVTVPGRRHLDAWSVPGAGGVVVVERPVPTGRRGRRATPSRTWLLDPFGLVGSPGPAVPAGAVVVHPRPWADGAAPGDPAGGARAAPLRAAAGGGAGAGDLSGLRPYVAGDRLALVHWASRARTGQWYVREFDREEGVVHRLVLDDRIGVHRRSGFEHLLGAALGRIDRAVAGGLTVELVTLSGRTARIAPTERGAVDARLLLAGLDPSAAAPGAPRAPTGATGVLTTATGAERLPPGTTVVVVT